MTKPTRRQPAKPRNCRPRLGGLYVNYAFTLVWLADVVWWWANDASYRSRPRLIEWSVQAFLGFIAFNATIVFASGFSRWFGIAACLALVFIWWRIGVAQES